MSNSPFSPFSIEAYDFELPESLIAQKPADPRDSSRLLVIDRARGTWEHRVFTDLPKYLDAQDVCVANHTRVIRARLLGTRMRTEPSPNPPGRVEFVMLEQLGPLTWEGLFKASAKYVPGVRFEVPTPDGKPLVGTLVRGSQDSPHGTVVAEFDRDPIESGAGELPLPHYIRRDASMESAREMDENRYQTVYAKDGASAAAPTAGLHFTDRVLGELRAKGVAWEDVNLNVGLGTFRPVKVDDIREHAMHSEQYEISPQVAERLMAAKSAGKRILAVGTTSVRTLESAWLVGGGRLQPGRGRTSIFIHPGEFEFQVVDRLLTNFHLPKSTLLMLVSAFAGRELVLEAYREAVREKYRFFSYGDAMLIV